MAKIEFDGARRLIIVEQGETSLDVQKDIYSAWKEWFISERNSRFLVAFHVVGGDSLPGDGEQLGLTFFLTNGWKIRPFEGDHRLIINGNLYSKDGTDPIVDTVGDYRVTVTMKVSNLVTTVNSGIITLPDNFGEHTSSTQNIEDATVTEEWTMTAS